MKRIVGLGIGLCLLALLGWRLAAHLGGGQAEGGATARPPVAVETAPVTTGPIEDVRLFTGSVHPLYRYLVATKLPGRVVALTARIGDRVGRGEVVARLDDAEVRQAVLEAEANLEIARSGLNEAAAQLELAAKELERARTLQEQDLAPSSDLDTAVSRHDVQVARVRLAEAQVAQRRAALAGERIRLEQTVLRASEPGYVGERLVDEGALLPANAAVVSIVGLDTVYVRTTVIERDYGRIAPGLPARIEVDAFADRSFAGRVARLAPVLREESRGAEMEIVAANPGAALKPGMYARAFVVLARRQDARLVPAAALVRREGVQGVFLLDETQTVVRFVAVETGIVGGGLVEIIAPVLAGRVVTLGQHLLEDGSPVLVPPTAAGSPE
ncbi:MAG: efflux RND transporter periplasmic adaptor subunit [Candidatus Krumholzibacteriia bacterium]